MVLLILVERGMEGFERGRKLKKMGLDAQDTAELFFKDVKVPKDERARRAGEVASIYLMEGLAEERLIGACRLCSPQAPPRLRHHARAIVTERHDIRQDRCRERSRTPSSSSPSSDTELDLAQCHVDQCVAAHFNAGKLTAESTPQRRSSSPPSSQVKSADLGVQLHGGAGYMDEYPISRQFTDARIAPIYAGASEVMKLIISRDCLGDAYEPFNKRNF